MDIIGINVEADTRKCPFCECQGYNLALVHCHHSALSSTKYDLWICGQCGGMCKEGADGHLLWVSADNSKIGNSNHPIKKPRKSPNDKKI